MPQPDRTESSVARPCSKCGYKGNARPCPDPDCPSRSAATPSRHIAVGTSRKLCRHVAERWRSQYGDAAPERFAGVQEKLDALGKDGTRAEIDAIIGNPTWTTEMCEVCERNVEKWVVLGEYDDTLNVCQECLEDAKVEVENAN